MAEVDEILRARGSVYGPFIMNGQISQATKDIWRLTPNWPSMSSDNREALDNIALKVSRILSGNPEYQDNWDDIAGYAQRVSYRIQGIDPNNIVPEPAPIRDRADLEEALRGYARVSNLPKEICQMCETLADRLAAYNGAEEFELDIPAFLRDEKP